MRKNQRGSSIVEFSLSATLLLALLGGFFDLSNVFLRYFLLQHTVRQAAEYAAYAPYDSLNATASANLRRAVTNIVLYGEAIPAGQAQPLVPDLKREQVTIDVKFESQVPVAITVGVQGFYVRGLFKTYMLPNKPRVTFPYLGEFAAL